MKLPNAIYETIKDKRIWKWEVGSTILYGIPATIRFIRRNSYIPILNLPGWSPSPYIPSNLVEKIMVNAFFPGGGGGVAGETFFSKYKGRPLTGKAKYISRLAGALLQYAGWTALQYIGNFQGIIGPHGENIFEPPEILPFNLLLAIASIFTPDMVEYTKSKIETLHRKLKG